MAKHVQRERLIDMDQETIRLIVVALGAIIAGMSGALIAGAYNSRNTIATIEAARVAAEAQREADRDVEHDRWLRDRKVEVYSKFLEEVHDLELSISELKLGFIEDTTGVVRKARNLSLVHLRVLAPRLVFDAAQEVMQSVKSLMMELLNIKDRSAPNMEAYKAAREDFEDKTTLLELRISKDLGIDVMG